MLIGYLRNEAKTQRYVRKICWSIICGYADAKTRPSSELHWWPIDGDPIIRPLNPNEVKILTDKFKSTTWTLNSRSKSEQK